MAKSKETFNKKEKEKKRQKQKQEKRERMEERRANATKGKSLNEMMAYVDEDGNISSTPPDPKKRRVITAEEIEIGVPKYDREPADLIEEGRVDYFNESKGFGFIVSSKGAKLFFHVNQLAGPVSERDIVNFEVERGPKGLVAVQVQKKPS